AYDAVEIGVDLLQRPGRNVLVEVPREGDLVASFRPGLIDPGVGNMGPDLCLEVGVDRRLGRVVGLGMAAPAEGDVLGVAQRRVGFALAFVGTGGEIADVAVVVVLSGWLP